MTCEPSNLDEFHSTFATETPNVPKLTATGRLHLSPLVEELCLMDCVIPLTSIPEFDGIREEGECDACDLEGLNLFGPASEAGDEFAPINMMRSSHLSRAEQGRIVALRRRAMRSQLRRRKTAWPMAGGQSQQDLQQMRACIYTPTEEQLEGESRPSVPLRLATHAISLSLVATALPIGAAMMTYNLLKGEDIKVTARLTTLTGLALTVLAGNPQLAQLIGA